MAAAARRGSLEPMSEHDDAKPGAGWSGYAATGPSGSGQGPGPAHTVRPPLRRERRSKMIAGVCGGLGRYFDIDPVVFRIILAVLVFFGGFGLLAYAAAWLFVPLDGEDQSEAHKLLTGRSALAAVAVAVLVALGFMAMVSTLSDGFKRAVPLLALAAVIIAVLVWRSEERRQPPPGTAPYAAGGWGPGDPDGSGSSDPSNPDHPQPWWRRPVPTAPAPGVGAGAGVGPIQDAVPTPPGSPTSAASEPPTFTTASFTAQTFAPQPFTTPPFATPPFTTPPTPPTGPEATMSLDPSGPVPRTRRISGLTLSGALLALGILGVLASAGAVHISWTAGFALAVMAVGAGMAIGGLFGRTRALIPLGLVLSIPLIVAGALGVPLRGETGDTIWRPTSAATLQSPYDLAAGKGQLDLTAIDPGNGTVRVAAHIGAGQLIVTVPDDVAIQVTGHVGLGQMRFTDGSKHSGIDVTNGFASAAQGTSKGTIVLDLRVGLGDVEVDRAAS
jgi:phage shock protein PspC (stress-responsive transcriptional regulator)